MSPRKARSIEPISFHPDRHRAELLDHRMRARLIASVRHIVARSRTHLTIPAALPRALQRIRRGPIPPLVFGAYFDLVIAINRDDLAAAQRCLDEISAVSCPDGQLRVIDLADPRSDSSADRYQRLFDTDPETRLLLAPPPAEIARACRSKIEAALAVLDAGCGNLAAEIRALVHEIVLAAPSTDAPNSVAFDGASSFMLWGAIVLNATSADTTLDMTQALVHESGHNLLFGFCADGALVDNDDAERFPSPLRDDLRPMDGIVHATYVVARMHYALDRLLRSNALTPAQIAQARRSMHAHATSFTDGMATITAFGRLTPLGQAVIAGAEQYMTAPQHVEKFYS